MRLKVLLSLLYCILSGNPNFSQTPPEPILVHLDSTSSDGDWYGVYLDPNADLAPERFTIHLEGVKEGSLSVNLVDIPGPGGTSVDYVIEKVGAEVYHLDFTLPSMQLERVVKLAIIGIIDNVDAKRAAPLLVNCQYLSEKNMSIYPNPALDFVKIRLPGKSMINATLRNLASGGELELDPLPVSPGGEWKLLFPSLPAGLYHLLLRTGSGLESTLLKIEK